MHRTCPICCCDGPGSRSRSPWWRRRFSQIFMCTAKWNVTRKALVNFRKMKLDFGFILAVAPAREVQWTYTAKLSKTYKKYYVLERYHGKYKAWALAWRHNSEVATSMRLVRTRKPFKLYYLKCIISLNDIWNIQLMNTDRDIERMLYTSSPFSLQNKREQLVADYS